MFLGKAIQYDAFMLARGIWKMGWLLTSLSVTVTGQTGQRIVLLFKHKALTVKAGTRRFAAWTLPKYHKRWALTSAKLSRKGWMASPHPHPKRGCSTSTLHRSGVTRTSPCWPAPHVAHWYGCPGLHLPQAQPNKLFPNSNTFFPLHRKSRLFMKNVQNLDCFQAC